MAQKLPNYLRTYRRRAGFTQDELAFLLGNGSGAHVSRYEHFSRAPSLRSALAYQVAFSANLEHLFAGLHERVAAGVRRRAEVLARKLEKRPPDKVTRQKLVALRIMISKRHKSTE